LYASKLTNSAEVVELPKRSGRLIEELSVGRRNFHNLADLKKTEPIGLRRMAQKQLVSWERPIIPGEQRSFQATLLLLCPSAQTSTARARLAQQRLPAVPDGAARADETVDRSRACAAGVGTGKQIVLSTECDCTQGPFGGIVVDLDKAVIAVA
jgi:hypothetical protein